MKTQFRIGEITAFRYWMLCERGLYSPQMGLLWNPDLPQSGDRGVYAIKNREDLYEWLARLEVRAALFALWFASPDLWGGLENPIGIVTGTVGMWGQVYEGSRGYCAESMRVLSLDGLNKGPKFRQWCFDSPELDRARRQYVKA